jgi:hypothetical protein
MTISDRDENLNHGAQSTSGYVVSSHLYSDIYPFSFVSAEELSSFKLQLGNRTITIDTRYCDPEEARKQGYDSAITNIVSWLRSQSTARLSYLNMLADRIESRQFEPTESAL